MDFSDSRYIRVEATGEVIRIYQEDVIKMSEEKQQIGERIDKPIVIMEPPTDEALFNNIDGKLNPKIKPEDKPDKHFREKW